MRAHARHAAGARALHVCHALRQSARMPAGRVRAARLAERIRSRASALLVGRPDVRLRAPVARVRRARSAASCCSSPASPSRSIALFSPVDSLGEDLFLMHMVQHILLLDIVPILCILGLTRGSCCGRSRGRCCTSSAAPACSPARCSRSAYVGAMWVWHIPALYDLALEHPLVHVLEHVSSRSPARCTGGTCCRRSAAGASAGWGPSCTWRRRSCSSGVLGIALTFAPDALYAFYEDQPRYWGLSAGDRPGDRRPDHGPGAVDHHGHRARGAVRPGARRERARGAAARALRRGLRGRDRPARAIARRSVGCSAERSSSLIEPKMSAMTPSATRRPGRACRGPHRSAARPSAGGHARSGGAARAPCPRARRRRRP